MVISAERRDDDTKLIHYRETFLRENRPLEYERLKNEGTLDQHLRSKAAECRAEQERIVDEGMTFDEQAYWWAVRSILLETAWD